MVTLYEHWPEGVQDNWINVPNLSHGMVTGIFNWRPNFPTGATESWPGVGNFALGVTSRLVSSVKMTGTCCKAYGYDDPQCTVGEPEAIESDFEYESVWGPGIVAPASNLESYWHNDRVQCITVTQC